MEAEERDEQDERRRGKFENWLSPSCAIYSIPTPEINKFIVIPCKGRREAQWFDELGLILMANKSGDYGGGGGDVHLNM